MQQLIEAATEALDQLEQMERMFRDDVEFMSALNKLRTALAQQEKASAKQLETFQGYFGFEGTTLSAVFTAPVGATPAEKDAAFMAALAQMADVEII